MEWFFIALLGIVLWSIGNFVDKILTDRFAGQWSGTWGLVLYSSLFSLVLIPVILLFSPAKFFIDAQNALILIFAGVAEITGIFLYLRALRHEDTSTVMPFFQIIPIFSYILGFAVLGEVLTVMQMLAGLGVIFGAALLTLDITTERHVRFKGSLAFLLVASAFCFALLDTLFKLGATREDYWTGILWQHIGIFLAGVAVFAVYKHARVGFLGSLRDSKMINLGLNTLNEIFYVAGVSLFLFALTLAPIALVGTVNAFQPVFAFIMGAILTILFPKLFQEQLGRKHLLHKGLAIAIVVISSIFLVS